MVKKRKKQDEEAQFFCFFLGSFGGFFDFPPSLGASDFLLRLAFHAENSSPPQLFVALISPAKNSRSRRKTPRDGGTKAWDGLLFRFR